MLEELCGYGRVVGRTYHEISLNEIQLIAQALVSSVSMSALNLVIVVVQSSDMRAGELGDLAGWASNTASNIKNLHAVLDTDLVGEVVLVAGNGLEEWLVGGEAAEVEGLAPSVLVEVGAQVVIVLGEGGVLCLAGLYHKSVYVQREYLHTAARVVATYSSDLLGLVLSRLVIPVLEVLINSDLLRSVVLVHPRRESSLLRGGLLVHGLAESLILLMVLWLQNVRHRDNS